MFLIASSFYQRCKINDYDKFDVESLNATQLDLIEKYIPLTTGTNVRENYDTCNIKYYPNDAYNESTLGLNVSNNTYELRECNEYVYSKKYYEETSTSEVN